MRASASSKRAVRATNTRSLSFVVHAPSSSTARRFGFSGRITGISANTLFCVPSAAVPASIFQRAPSTAIVPAGTAIVRPRPSAGSARSFAGSTPLRPGCTSAALIAAIISVPPPPEEPAMNWSAAAMFSAVAGFGSGHSTAVLPAKVMMLKVSFGRMRAIALRASSFDFSMGKPFIDPDTSSTNTSSRGRISAGATRAGGSSMSAKKPPFASASRESEVCAKNAGSTAPPPVFQRSTKSRFGIVFWSTSEITRCAGELPSTRTSCCTLSIVPSGTPPESIVTFTEMSWPARVSGRVGIGVILSASGTWSVGFANPVPPARPCAAAVTKKKRPLISPIDAVGEKTPRSALPLAYFAKNGTPSAYASIASIAALSAARTGIASFSIRSRRGPAIAAPGSVSTRAGPRSTRPSRTVQPSESFGSAVPASVLLPGM